LEKLIANDLKILHGDHEVFKDEFEQFKHILGVETNSSALAFFKLMRKQQKTISWKQIADLLQFLEDMKENIQQVIRNEEECPRGEDEDPTAGELKVLLNIASDDHANWLFSAVSLRHDDKITWLEIRDYLDEWDEERSKVTAHFEDQKAKRITDRDLKARIYNIHDVIQKSEERGPMGSLRKDFKPKYEAKPKGYKLNTPLKPQQIKSDNLAIRVSKTAQNMQGRLPKVYIFGTDEEICGSPNVGHGFIAITILDMRSRGEVHRNITLVGQNGSSVRSSSVLLQKSVNSYFQGLDINTTENTFLRTAEINWNRQEAYKSIFNEAKEGDIVCALSKTCPFYVSARAALNKGLHVITIPVFDNHEYDDLVALASKKNRLLSYYAPWHYHQEFLQARQKIVQSGDFIFSQSTTISRRPILVPKDGYDLLLTYIFHHIEFHIWCLLGLAEPIEVKASASTSPSGSTLGMTVIVKWVNLTSKIEGTAIYTVCLSREEPNPRERFFYRGTKTTVEVDLKRGKQDTMMNLVPDSRKRFIGQSSACYQALKDFVDSAKDIESGIASAEDFIGMSIDIGRIVSAVISYARISLARKKSVAFSLAPIGRLGAV